MYAASVNNSRRSCFYIGKFLGLDCTKPVNWLPERINNSAQQFFADRHADNRVGTFDRIAFFNLRVRTEDNHPDAVFAEVKCHTLDAGGELNHLVIFNTGQPVNGSNTVPDRQNTADFFHIRVKVVLFYLLFQNCGNFLCFYRHIRLPFLIVCFTKTIS